MLYGLQYLLPSRLAGILECEIGVLEIEGPEVGVLDAGVLRLGTRSLRLRSWGLRFVA